MPDDSRRVIVTGFREDVPDSRRVDLADPPGQVDALPTAVVQAAAAGLPWWPQGLGGFPRSSPTSRESLIRRAIGARPWRSTVLPPTRARLLMGKVERSDITRSCSRRPSGSTGCY